MIDTMTQSSPPAARIRPTVDPTAVRRSILGVLYRAKASHLGSCMSAVEALVAMYGFVDIDKVRAKAPDRSRIIVSKGHSAAAVYATMMHYGLMPPEALETYHNDTSMLTGHVNHCVPCVEHSTGGLGHGLAVAAGCAISLRNHGHSDSSVLVLTGDGEIQEGSVWEALLLVRHHRLTNLITLVDNNGIGGVTHSADVINMKPLAQRFAGFGFRVADVDGHDVKAIAQALAELRRGQDPGVIICNTVKGKGVPSAEDQPIWHYRPLNEAVYKEAIAHLAKL